MKRFFAVTTLFTIISLSAFGQINIIEESGKTHEYLFGPGRTIADWIFEFRLVYDRYPINKDELLDCFMDTPFPECEFDFIAEMISYRDSIFVERMIDKNSILTTKGDTCLFHASEGDPILFLDNETIRCVGGAEELIKNDSPTMYDWGKTHPCFYDETGRSLKLLPTAQFPFPPSLQERFQYYVTMKSTGLFKTETDMDKVLMPFSITKDGEFFYDYSYLKDVHLFYQKREDALDLRSSHSVSIVEAIDSEYLEMVKEIMMSFMRTHPKVERMRIWEDIRFNNAPSTAIHCME